MVPSARPVGKLTRSWALPSGTGWSPAPVWMHTGLVSTRLKKVLGLAAAIVLLLGAWGCKKTQDDAPVAPPPELRSFVSPSLLREHLMAAAPVLLLDIRRAADYDQGHIPTSMNVDFEALLPTGKNRLRKRERRVISALLTDSGVRKQLDAVVIAGSSREGFIRAAATCWVLSLAGADKCHVLEGGIESWHRAKGEMVKDRYLPKRTQPLEIPAPPPNWVTLEDLRETMIETESVMLDLRDDPIEDLIPGALRGHLLDAIGVDGRVDREALKQRVIESGVLVETRVLVLGESVVDGAAGWFLLRHGAGISGATLFPGGFRLYKTHPQLPLQRAKKVSSVP